MAGLQNPSLKGPFVNLDGIYATWIGIGANPYPGRVDPVKIDEWPLKAGILQTGHQVCKNRADGPDFAPFSPGAVGVRSICSCQELSSSPSSSRTPWTSTATSSPTSASVATSPNTSLGSSPRGAKPPP